jgi:hypothetical protein
MQAEAVIQFLFAGTVILFETTRLLFRSHGGRDEEEFIRRTLTRKSTGMWAVRHGLRRRHALDSGASILENRRGCMACGPRF